MLGLRDVTRIRRTAGALTDGFASPPTETESTVRMAIQPMSGRRLEALPQGLRERVTHMGLSPSAELRPDSQHEGLGDLIVYQGARYLVVSVAQCDRYTQRPHVEALLQRLPEGQSI